MRLALDDKDRIRPWYKGMNNMTPGEMDDWLTFQRKEFYKVMALMVIAPAILMVVYALNMDEKGVYEYTLIVSGICLGMILLSLEAILTQYKRVRLVKEEKGVIL